MSEGDQKTLSCGCVVIAYRDFLGRVVGKVVTRGGQCARAGHEPDQVIVLPGREHARSE